MNDRLSQCRWPELSNQYYLALRIAVEYILERYEAMGIIASGTIIRGNPDPASDFDIYVIHKDTFRQRVQKFYNNIPTEIFVNPPQSVETYFKEEQRSRKPLTAHMLATGFVILNLDPIIDELREKAKHNLSLPPEAPPDLAPFRYFPALLFEDAIDVAETDLATSQMILFQAVNEMLQFCFIQAGKFIPRQKSILHELEQIDEKTAALARNFFETSSFEVKLDIADKIADRTIQKRGFFEWETSPEMLSF
jgi:hypothetical protein